MLYQRAARVTIVTIHSLSVHSDQLKDQVDLVEGYTVGSMAVQNDRLVGEAWVGHPYYELIDNSTDFEIKMRHPSCRGMAGRQICEAEVPGGRRHCS